MLYMDDINGNGEINTCSHLSNNPKSSNERTGTSVDTPNVSACANCEENEKLLDNMFSEQDKLKKEHDKLKEKYDTLETEYSTMKHEYCCMTEKMAGVLEERGTLENTNDENSNVNLGRRFTELYSSEWINISKFIKKDEKMKMLPEMERIDLITKLMQKVYESCVEKAERHIRSFLLLEDTDVISAANKFPALYKIRKQIGQDEQVKKRVSKEIVKSVLVKEALESEDVKAKLELFLEDIAECCWLMTISQPRLVLNFSVCEKMYEGEFKEKFSQFAPEKNVKSEVFKKGIIIKIVWPCVEDENGLFCSKGEVITVFEGNNED